MKYLVSRTWGFNRNAPAVVSFKVESQCPLDAASKVEKLIPYEKMKWTEFRASGGRVSSTYETDRKISETFETILSVSPEDDSTKTEYYKIRHIIEIEKIDISNEEQK